jgi:serine/threonine-protein kinase
VIAAGLPSVPCTWLDLVDSSAAGDSISLTFRGVAGKPAEAQGMIGQVLTAKGLQAGSINFNDVSPIDARECGPLEAFRQIREAGASRLSVAQRSFEGVKLGSEAGSEAGKIGAKAVIQLNLNGLSSDLALVGVEGSGEMTEFVTQRSDITDSPDVEQPQPGNYRFTLYTTHTGWSGILMLTGQGPFDQSLLNGPVGSRGADWPTKFLARAKQRGWKSEMVWYRTVDEVPN